MSAHDSDVLIANCDFLGAKNLTDVDYWTLMQQYEYKLAFCQRFLEENSEKHFGFLLCTLNISLIDWFLAHCKLILRQIFV